MPPLRWTIVSNRVEPLPLSSSALPLGILSDQVYTAESFAIRPGDLFLLYTDGITEATGVAKELYGQHRLRDSMQREVTNVERTVQRVIRDVDVFRTSKAPSDDMCVVSFSRLADGRLVAPPVGQGVILQECGDASDRIVNRQDASHITGTFARKRGQVHIARKRGQVHILPNVSNCHLDSCLRGRPRGRVEKSKPNCLAICSTRA